MDYPFIPCQIKQLPHEQQIEAAARACRLNPLNQPPLAIKGIVPIEPMRLALVTKKYWGTHGVNLTVSFMGNAPGDLVARILSHMNAWGTYCKATFTPVQANGQVRIAFARDGYWSYLGTDILGIPANEPTMNLEAFSMQTPESEYHRVVRHETGHTLGFPHEHMRAELVSRLDPAKTIAYFLKNDGWDQQTVMQQVLTPLGAASITGTEHADQDSIMCYQLPGEITKDGQPIRGGNDIDSQDQAFAGKVYPLGTAPPPPPPPPPPVTSLRKQVDDVFAKAGAKANRRNKATLNAARIIIDPFLG